MSPFQKALALLHNALAGRDARAIEEAATALQQVLHHISAEDGPALCAVQVELSFLHRFYAQTQNLRLAPSGYVHAHDHLARA